MLGGYKISSRETWMTVKPSKTLFLSLSLSLFLFLLILPSYILLCFFRHQFIKISGISHWIYFPIEQLPYFSIPWTYDVIKESDFHNVFISWKRYKFDHLRLRCIFFWKFMSSLTLWFNILYCQNLNKLCWKNH